ncbi:MAG TPA: hypothetical protein PKA95_17320, partial [Thermomicrobiales bacterium]|nr:hypothetical protein [Thermomicrobiales bacterium]
RQRAPVADQFAAHLVWMSPEPLLPGRSYLMKINHATLPATVTELKHRVGGSRLDLATVNDRAFVPIATMPSWLQGFARHQPVTPVTETIRAALLGAPAGNDAWLAVAWCAVIIVGSIALSAALFRRRTA